VPFIKYGFCKTARLYKSDEKLAVSAELLRYPPTDHVNELELLSFPNPEDATLRLVRLWPWDIAEVRKMKIMKIKLFII
jgi:hypothetical protein